MTAYQVQIRDGAYDKVKEDLPSYVITDVDLEKTYYPQLRTNLEQLGGNPIIRFVAVGIASARNREIRHAGTSLLAVPVQIAVQQRVDPKDTDKIDCLVELVEQVMQSLCDDDLVAGEDFSWKETDPLRDENGLIFSYEQLTVENVFQAIFTARYDYIKQP